MSQENVETLRRAVDPFNRRDIPAFLDTLAPDVEWIPIMATLEDRVYRGRDEVLRWVEALDADWEFFEIHPDQFHDLGDRVLTFGHWRARGRVSGVTLENQPAAWLHEVKGGKIARMQTFTDRAEALEAVGLSEQDAHADS